MIEKFDDLVLAIHVVAGFFSLVIFWIPALVKKGSKLHIRAGRAYIWGMWTVIATAIVLCINNVVFGDYLIAGFLGFIAMLTIAPLWYGIRIIRHKHAVTRQYFRTRKSLHAIIVIAALALLVWGVKLRFAGMAVLLLIFGILGLTSIRELIITYNCMRQRPWLVEHLNGMFSTAIAAHTAFLVFGGQSILGSVFHGRMTIVLWVAPSIVGTIAIMRQSNKYRKKAKTQVSSPGP